MDQIKSFSIRSRRYHKHLENLRIKFDSKLTIGINGGLFYIEPSLIGFLKIVLDSGKDTVVLFDMNNRPIKIDNIHDNYEHILAIYHEVMNEYLYEFQQIKTLDINSLYSDQKDEEK